MHPQFRRRIDGLQRSREGQGGPIDSGGGPPHDGGMEQRVAKLEAEIPTIRERLTKIETRLDYVATKDDVTKLEATLLKWFVGTALTMTALAFAAAKFVN